MLILSSTGLVNWNPLIDSLLLNLVNSSGTWVKESLEILERSNVIIQKAKHSKKEYAHRAKFEEKLWKMAWSWKKTPSTMP